MSDYEHNAMTYQERIAALERELAAAKEEITRLHEKNCADNEWKDADRAQLTHELVALRASLAELRKVADDLDDHSGHGPNCMMFAGVARCNCGRSESAAAFAAWKARNP